MKLQLSICSSLLWLSIALFYQCVTPPTTDKVAAGNAVLPTTAKPAQVALADVSCWVEDGMFYAVALVDSQEPFWRKFWVELSVVDANNQVVKFKNDSFCLVATHADALPPRGRTSFMAVWKLSDLSGTPDSIVLHGAQSTEVGAGSILLTSNVGGLISMQVIKQDTTILWQVNGVLENPLPETAQNPCIDVLVYGLDKKLYFSQALSLNTDTTIVKAATYGMVLPNEKRNFGLFISYDKLPKILGKKKIGRVDINAFERREK